MTVFQGAGQVIGFMNSMIDPSTGLQANLDDNTKLAIADMQKIGLNLLFDAVQGDAGLGFTINSESDFAEAEARMKEEMAKAPEMIAKMNYLMEMVSDGDYLHFTVNEE